MSASREYEAQIASGVKEADAAFHTDTLLETYQNTEQLEECIQDAVNSNADGIIMQGISEADSALRKAEDQGIPVVFYDHNESQLENAGFISVDNQKAAEDAVQFLEQQMTGEKNILIITASADSDVLKQRMNGCAEEAAHYTDMRISEVIEDAGDELLLKEKLNQAIEEHPEINAVICLGGAGSESLGGLIREYRTEHPLTAVVFDLTEKTTEYVRDGIYQAVMMQDTKKIGYEAVQLLHGMNDRKDLSAADLTVNIQMTTVTGDNLNDYSEALKHEKLEWNQY